MGCKGILVNSAMALECHHLLPFVLTLKHCQNHRPSQMLLSLQGMQTGESQGHPPHKLRWFWMERLLMAAFKGYISGLWEDTQFSLRTKAATSWQNKITPFNIFKSTVCPTYLWKKKVFILLGCIVIYKIVIFIYGFLVTFKQIVFLIMNTLMVFETRLITILNYLLLNLVLVKDAG